MRRTRQPLEMIFPPTGVAVAESRHARGFFMPPMRHDYLKVLLVFAGEGRLRFGAEVLPLTAGDAAVVPPGCEHRIEDVRPLSLYVVGFRSRDYAVAEVRRSDAPWHAASAGPALLGLARRLLHEQETARPGADAMVRGLAWQMLAVLARFPTETEDRPASASAARVAAAARELRERFYEPLRIDDEARRAGLSRRRFTQLFREVTGQTWWHALNAARLDHAERILRTTDRSVAAVAFECGYGDLSGFYRAWARRHGASPTGKSGKRKAETGNLKRERKGGAQSEHR